MTWRRWRPRSLLGSRHLRAREVEVAVALLLLMLASALFFVWPQLDLRASAPFHLGDGRFAGNSSRVVVGVYEVVPWIGRGGALAGLVVALLWWRAPGPLGVRWWRRSMVFALVMLLAVAGLVNGVLKEHWGRARPMAVQQFGGPQAFTPVWVMTSQCPRNCSFVSGHAATGFALMSIGMLGSCAARRRWRRIGLVAGAVVGLGRVAQGSHFASDVVLAGLLVWLSACALRWAWLLVKARRRQRYAGRRLAWG